MTKLINSIRIKHYRAFKPDEELCLELTDFNKVSFLVGANNTGKSLLTRMFSVFNYSLLGKENTDYFNDTNLFSDNDFFELRASEPLEFKFEINTEVFREMTDPDLVKLVPFRKLFLCFKVIKCYDRANLCVYLHDGMLNSDSHWYDVNQATLSCRYNNHFNTGLKKDEVRRSCYRLYEEIKKRILVFDSIRAFDRDNGSSFFVSGHSLIKWMGDNVNPGQIREVKHKVKNWLQGEFNLEAPVSVEVEDKEKMLWFTFEDYLKLSSKEVGTGYTMLYILLMEIARSTKELILIDEIESHLQPGLIRVLMKIIRRHGRAQYIIATHSPTVMESSLEEDRLYRFKKQDKHCSFEGFFRDRSSAGTKDARILREVCNELGILPGDALLSNSVIWVEGPSEVLWIRAWLNRYYPIYKKKTGLKENIIEGLHYSILMTGGSSISHLSFSENETSLEEIVEDYPLHVLRVNPNPFVMIDSDNSSAKSRKQQRLLRIANELNEQNKLQPGIDSFEEDLGSNLQKISNLWILSGRELENYAHPQVLKDFYTNRSQHGSSKITGVELCDLWDVFSGTDGVGKILTNRQITNVSEPSGTIIHKDPLARYVFNNLETKHFELEPDGMLHPNKDMMEDLTRNLDKMLNYIVKVSGIF